MKKDHHGRLADDPGVRRLGRKERLAIVHQGNEQPITGAATHDERGGQGDGCGDDQADQAGGTQVAKKSDLQAAEQESNQVKEHENKARNR